MTVRLVGPPRRRDAPRFDRSLLRAHAVDVLRALGHEDSELSVTLVDDQAMAELNGGWRAPISGIGARSSATW